MQKMWQKAIQMNSRPTDADQSISKPLAGTLYHWTLVHSLNSPYAVVVAVRRKLTIGEALTTIPFRITSVLVSFDLQNMQIETQNSVYKLACGGYGLLVPHDMLGHEILSQVVAEQLIRKLELSVEHLH